MSVQDLNLLVQYKAIQNKRIHKNKLKRTATGQLHKLHRSLRLLQIAPDQPEDFGDHLKNA